MNGLMTTPCDVFRRAFEDIELSDTGHFPLCSSWSPLHFGLFTPLRAETSAGAIVASSLIHFHQISTRVPRAFFIYFHEGNECTLHKKRTTCCSSSYFNTCESMYVHGLHSIMGVTSLYSSKSWMT